MGVISIRTATGFYERNGVTSSGISAKLEEAIALYNKLPSGVVKGDLIGVDSDGNWAKLDKGNDKEILSQDSSAPLGVVWKKVTIGG